MFKKFFVDIVYIVDMQNFWYPAGLPNAGLSKPNSDVSPKDRFLE
jgi:hypothetical protein